TRTDLFAPGFLITSAGPNTAPDPTRALSVQDGTAQASAFVAGAVLLLQQRFRELTRSFGDPNQTLPDLDLVEGLLRQGGVKFQDLEDETGRMIDDVPSCGATFVRLDVLGALNAMQRRYEVDLDRIHTQLLEQPRPATGNSRPTVPKGAKILG